MRAALIVAADDAALREQLLARESVDDGLIDAIRRDELALEMLSRDFYVERLVSREEFLAARGDLSARLKTNRLRLAKASRTRVLGDLVAGGSVLGRAWETGSLEWRRSVVGALLEQVVIRPGQPGRRPFDPGRVKLVWKH
ncbi:MAG: hypothetical protein HY875_10645 [Chloroflexi bacterium]|nr:hypothetical protein [Chloroflexota bacterium]